LFQIFGKKGDRGNSLIASKNYKEYRDKLGPLLNSWQCMKNKQGRSFSEYFLKYKQKLLYENVIKPNEGQYDVNNLDDYFQDYYEEGRHF
jgi:hypothetical protein